MDKKLLWIMAFVLVLTFTACSGVPANIDPLVTDSSTNGATTGTPTKSSSEEIAHDANSPAHADSVSRGSQSGDDSFVTFPLAEKLTFTYWIIEEPFAWMSLSDVLEAPAFAALAERTNIYPEYTPISWEALTEQYSLLLASGDYHDVIEMANDSFSPEQLLENEICIDLTNLIPTYMPNYYSLVNSDPALHLDVIDSAGRYLMIYGIYDEIPMSPTGLVIRKDVLDEHDLALPVTYDDLETCLEVFKEEGYIHPMTMATTGSYTDSNMESGFNVGSRLYRDGKTVKYGPMEDGYLDYLTKMNNWFNKQLISSSFPGDPSWANGQPDDRLYRHETGFYVMNANALGASWRASTDDNDFYLSSLERPVKEDGSSRVWSTVGGSGRIYNATMISSDCANEIVPILLQYFDYCYSDEGYELTSFGVEGYTYLKDENGACYYNDQVVMTTTFDETLMSVWTAGLVNHPGYYNDKEVDLGYFRGSETVNLQRIWSCAGTDFGVLPKLIFTAEESEIYSSILNDCNTYVEENTVKFIMGERPLSDFDAFREELERFGIHEALEIQQEAFNRYYTR